MTDEQRAALSPDSEEYRLRYVSRSIRTSEDSERTPTSLPSRVIGSKIQVAGWSSYLMLLWALKTSLLVFYMRLTVCIAATRGPSVAPPDC